MADGKARAAPVATDRDRLESPAFARNHGPIRDVLTALLDGRSGDLLEIGSGSGQHAVALAQALPALTWWPSDCVEAHLTSIEAWRRSAGPSNLRPPVFLDAGTDDWALGRPGRPPADDLAAILAVNVLHISPWRVTEALLAGAARHLAGAGVLAVYGPFRRDGRHTAPSNAQFDAMLRADNPEWGVRDTADITAAAAVHGLRLSRIIAMPANNLILVLDRAP